jgi:hypothetical protein
MATVGVVIASVVAAEGPTSVVEMAADVLMLPIVEAAHPQHALAAVAAPTVIRPCVPPMPQQRMETRPMVPLTQQQHTALRPMVRLMPRQLVVGRPMAPPMPQQRIVADHMVVEGDRTAAVADRMVVADTTRG